MDIFQSIVEFVDIDSKLTDGGNQKKDVFSTLIISGIGH